MQNAFIVSDRNNKPYAVVGILAGGSEFIPIAESARGWSSWMNDEYATRKITKEQLVVTLDNTMSVEGPMQVNRTTKPKIDELLRQSKKPKIVQSIEEAKEEKSIEPVPVISLMDVPLDYLENSDWKNTVNFKAKSFIADVNKSTFSYEVKRTRAAWDPTLSIPGTDRRGGWRCPPGTRYGGQITDRFGRNCGWGVARRLANEISDLGERMENVGDQRRVRRVARRNERVARRLAQGGRVERAARAVGNALDFTGQGAPTQQRGNGRQNRGAGLVERVAGRVANALDTNTSPRGGARQRRGTNAPARVQPQTRNRGGIVERAAGRLADILDSDTSPAPRRQQGRPRPAAPRAPRTRQPVPRQPRNARPSRVDNVSGVQVPAGAPRADETLEQYKRRKYNEHQARVRKIREQGGRAGLLRYEEWDQFHGPAVQENWNRAQERNAGRAGRRTATVARTARTATRRPNQADAPDAVQPPRRQRLPFSPYKHQRGLASEEAGWKKIDAINNDVNNLEMRDLHLVEYNGKHYVVNGPDAVRAALDAGAVRKERNAPSAPSPRVTQAPQNRSGSPINVRDLQQPSNGLAPHNPRRGEQAMGHKVVAGMLIPHGVAVGENGISDKNGAIEHVRNGGKLDDVPDNFLKDAIMANAAMPGQPQNGKRFILEVDPGNGINNRLQPDPMNKTYLVKDTVSDKKYILKTPGYSKNEAVGEQAAAVLGQLAGRPMSRVRLAGKEQDVVSSQRGGGGQNIRKNVPILVEHFGDAVDARIEGGGVRDKSVANAPSNAARLFIDGFLGNQDRHGGNYLWANGNELLPIDHGIFVNEAGTLGRLRVVTQADASRLIGIDGSGQIKANIARLTNEDVTAIIQSMKNNWELSGMRQSVINSNVLAFDQSLRNLVAAARA